MSNKLSTIFSTEKSETTYYVVQGEQLKNMWFDEGYKRDTVERARKDLQAISKRIPSLKHRIMKCTTIEEVVE